MPNRTKKPIDAFDIPDGVDHVLSDVTGRVYEVQAVLQLSSNFLAEKTHPTMEELARIMMAMDSALRTLEPIPDLIGCQVSLANAVNAKIAQISEASSQR